MDPATLAAAATSLLAPYLAKAGRAILEHATDALPGEVAHVWDSITKHFEGKPAAAAAATELAQQPSDEDQQAAFNIQLKLALKNDPDFAAALEELVKKATPAQPGGQTVTFTSGNISGSAVVIGSNNSTNVKSGN